MKEGDSTADLKGTLPGPHWQRRLWPAATRQLRNGSQHVYRPCWLFFNIKVCGDFFIDSAATFSVECFR